MTPGDPAGAWARVAVALLAVLGSACGSGNDSGGGAVPAAVSVAPPIEVAIAGYAGIAMEPFVSRDGRFLLFNNSNDPAVNTDLHFASRINDLHWTYGGPIAGANSALLEGTTRRSGSTASATSSRRRR